MLGEFLYQLTPRDQTSERIQLFNFRINPQAASVTIDCDYQVPNEHILVLHNAHCEASPAGGQHVSSANLMFVEAGGGQFRVINQLTTNGLANAASGETNLLAIPNGSPGVVKYHGEIYIPPGATVKFRATFDLGVAANTALMDLIGILIPKGNSSV